MNNEFGEYLRNTRLKNNLSIRQLADLSQVSNAYLSQVENGKRSTPSPEILKKICYHLNVSYNEIMQRSGYLKFNNTFNFDFDEFPKTTFLKLIYLIKNVGYSNEDIKKLLFIENNSNTADMLFLQSNNWEVIVEKIPILVLKSCIDIIIENLNEDFLSNNFTVDFNTKKK